MLLASPSIKELPGSSLTGGGVHLGAADASTPRPLSAIGKRASTLLPRVYAGGAIRNQFFCSPQFSAQLRPRRYAAGHERKDTEDHFEGGTMLMADPSKPGQPRDLATVGKRVSTLLPKQYGGGHERKDTEPPTLADLRRREHAGLHRRARARVALAALAADVAPVDARLRLAFDDAAVPVPAHLPRALEARVLHHLPDDVPDDLAVAELLDSSEQHAVLVVRPLVLVGDVGAALCMLGRHFLRRRRRVATGTKSSSRLFATADPRRRCDHARRKRDGDFCAPPGRDRRALPPACAAIPAGAASICCTAEAPRNFSG